MPTKPLDQRLAPLIRHRLVADCHAPRQVICRTTSCRCSPCKISRQQPRKLTSFDRMHDRPCQVLPARVSGTLPAGRIVVTDRLAYSK